MSSSAERIQEMLSRFEEQAQQAGRLQSAMQEMRGTASSQDRSVTVTVAPSGAVLDLKLEPNAVRRSANELQQQIMAVIREATATAAEQLDQAAAPILGEQYEQFQEAFNAGVPAMKPASEDTQQASSDSAPRTGGRGRPDTDDWDDDSSNDSFLR
ncbi:hypothetical protein GCM10009854_22820 [Saccharopolyspora halophila]|uniref:YbaB/EbfC family DNA-binding protein n=1 Tax=Saccharopolyspora halophila TaxID=405551 RepID=A0ABN3G6T0_9PSEU